MDRETILMWFSGALVAYLVYVELRPYWREQVGLRTLIPYSEAAQMIYEEYRHVEMVSGLLSDSRHPRPVEDVMGSWIEDGIKRGIIQAFGRREHSREIEKIPANVSIETGVVFERSDGGFDDEIAALHADEKVYWRGLTFKRKDILAYLKDLESDAITRQNSQTIKKEGR